MLPILQIGPLALQLPGLLLILGVWVGSLLVERVAKRRDLPSSKISNMIFYALIGGIIAARLGYVLRFFDLYLQSPLGIFALNPNTLSMFEGLVGACLIGLIYQQRAGLPFWRTMDALTPSLALFMIFLGLAHLASGDAFGAESSLPWAIELWGANRHPTQLYEIFTAIIIFLAISRLSREKAFDGFIFLTFTALAALQRFIVEAFRGDSIIILESVRSAQLTSLLLLILALIGLHLQARAFIDNQPSISE